MHLMALPSSEFFAPLMIQAMQAALSLERNGPDCVDVG